MAIQSNILKGPTIVLLTKSNESFPMLVNEDGTIRLPMPEEMQQMRDSGQVG